MKIINNSVKRRRRVPVWIIVIGVPLFCILFQLLFWQIEIGDTLTASGDVSCQLVDIGQGGGLRASFEAMRNNRRLYLSDGSFFYVPKSDFDRCWIAKPFRMREDGYVNHVTLQYRRLFFGGDSVARVISLERTNGVLRIGKGSLEISEK